MITGLYHRQYFLDKLKSAITQAVNGTQQSALIYISIDDFESVRDMIGISGCDILIADIAKILQKHAIEGQTLARFGAHSYVSLGATKDRKLVEKLAVPNNSM